MVYVDLWTPKMPQSTGLSSVDILNGQDAPVAVTQLRSQIAAGFTVRHS